jgi:DNA-binding transcriptional ArsR family regulator
METTAATRDPLSLVFAALADPTRRAILARLAGGTSTVSEIAGDFRDAMSLPAVTKHLKVLERARLIQKTRDAQFRPCQLDAAALQEAVAWLEPYRALWEARFDRLEAYLARTAPATKPQTSAKTTGTKKTTSRKTTSKKTKGTASHARKEAK